MSSLLTSALDYLSKGISVIPVGPKKTPLVPEWKEYQTRFPTKEEVTNWWSENPDANIAIVTGKLSGLAVIDVEKGGTIKPYPRTLTIATGGGGWHLYYDYVEGVGNRGRVAELTDIRGEGGYVIAPPSVHASGKKYKVILKVPRVPFPKEMFTDAPKADWNEINQGVTEGSRNDSMARFMGKHMNRFHPSEWETQLWPFFQWQNQKNTPPLDERELRQIFESIGSKAAPGNTVTLERTEDKVEVLPLVEVAKAFESQQSETFPTGIKEFDKMMKGGLMIGDLVTITGITGEGKTTWSQSLTYNLAKDGVPCVWFSYEVLMKELWEKFQEMGVDDSMVTYSPMKMVSGNIEWVESMLIEAKEKYGAKVAFIDHLGRLSRPLRGPADGANMSAYIGSICQELKRMAVEHEMVIVIMAHVTKLHGREITTDDLIHSVGVGQESDFVLSIKRAKGDDKTRSKLSILKNRRTGALSSVTLTMRGGRLKTDEELPLEDRSDHY